MKKNSHISPLKPDGTPKSKYEIETEKNILLNAYRRDNLVLNDRIYDLTDNVIPQKDIVINDLNELVKTQQKEIVRLSKQKGWFY